MRKHPSRQDRTPSLLPGLQARVHYGWVVVAATFLTVVAATGARSAAGVLIRPLEDDFGWSRGAISWALSLSLLVYGLAAPRSGRIADRYGPFDLALLENGMYSLAEAPGRVEVVPEGFLHDDPAPTFLLVRHAGCP